LLKPPLCVEESTQPEITTRPVVVGGDVVMPAPKPVVPDVPSDDDTCSTCSSVDLDTVVTPSVRAERKRPPALDSSPSYRQYVESERKQTSMPVFIRNPLLPADNAPANQVLMVGSVLIEPLCKHLLEGKCPFGKEKCNHFVKKQKCFGANCRFEHGIRKPASGAVSVASAAL
jgi:hypothetical protein